ncbi:MAG: Sjogren's syndrome/scleroderma autoantigen 1 family protein [Candidatus Bathyarchaeia archaeon]
MSGEMKGMADLLRSGAKMLSRSCPECATPLFQLKSGDIVCANCKRRVLIVPEGEEATAEAGIRLESVEKVIVDKLVTLGEAMSQESDPEALRSLSELMDSLLGNLEKLRASRKS